MEFPFLFPPSETRTRPTILVLADINGGGDSYLSNQFLPGLPVGTGNVGGGGPFTGANNGSFNFGNTPGEYFAVTVPEPASIGLLGGAMSCSVPDAVEG